MKDLFRRPTPDTTVARPAAEPASAQRRALPGPFDDSPRMTSQRRLLDRFREVGPAPRVATLVQAVKAAKGEGRAAELGQGLQRMVAPGSGGVFQLRPMNFYRVYELPFKGLKFNGYKGERNPHAAQGVNDLRSRGVIHTSADLIGGHLLKAELGGEDVRDNVVPWAASAERKFTTYEDGYQEMIAKRYRWRKGEAGTNWNEEWTWPFATNAQFVSRKLDDFAYDWDPKTGNGGWSAEELREILDVLSAIPTEMMVNAGNTLDFFTNSGEDVSGAIKILKKPPDAGDALLPNVDAHGEDEQNKKYKNRVEHNWKVMLSNADRMLDNMKNEEWYEHLATYWWEQKYELTTALSYMAMDGPVGTRKDIAPKKMFTLEKSDFFTSQGEMTKGWESMRRAAIDNPVRLQSRRLESTRHRLESLAYDGYYKTVNALIDWEAVVPHARWPKIDL